MSITNVAVPNSYSLYVNSADRGTGVNGNFTLRPCSFANGLLPVVIRLRQFIAPNLVPTITTSVNDVLSFTFNAVRYSITIASNFYDANSLATYIQQAITALGLVNLTFTFNNVSNYFSVTIPINSSFYFSAQSNAEFRCSQIIGAINLEGQVTQTAGSTKTLVLLPPRLEGTSYIDVSLGIPYSQLHTGGKTGIIARVPVNSYYGTKIIWEPSTEATEGFPTTIAELSSLQIILYDEWGGIFFIPPNHSAALTFHLDYT